jgi:hypothetical protein
MDDSKPHTGKVVNGTAEATTCIPCARKRATLSRPHSALSALHDRDAFGDRLDRYADS